MITYGTFVARLIFFHFAGYAKSMLKKPFLRQEFLHVPRKRQRVTVHRVDKRLPKVRPDFYFVRKSTFRILARFGALLQVLSDNFHSFCPVMIQQGNCEFDSQYSQS